MLMCRMRGRPQRSLRGTAMTEWGTRGLYNAGSCMYVYGRYAQPCPTRMEDHGVMQVRQPTCAMHNSVPLYAEVGSDDDE